MRILVVTGKLAKDNVFSVVKAVEKLKLKFKIDVFIVDVDVAAFITTRHIDEIAKKVNLRQYDLILLPGNAKGNWKKLEEKYKTKVRLGSVHAADLIHILKYMNEKEFELSHTIPACKLLSSVIAEEILEKIDSVEEGRDTVEVGNVIVGKGRMKVVAEIVDASEMQRDELINKIEYYLNSGADIIDLGIPLECNAEKAVKAAKIALDFCDAVSVDTFNPKIIEECVKVGVHMIMSVSWENVKALENIENQAVVLVDRNVEKLLNLVSFAKSKGKSVIADCILDAPLLTFRSMLRYYQFRKKDNRTPILFGAGNVTELCDADSVGINALLAFIAEEIGVDAIFTTEASFKTCGSIKELRVASCMAKAAKIRKSPPKDFGFNLLVLKDKSKMVEDFWKAKLEVEARPNLEFIRDPLGDFKIFVDSKSSSVVAVHNDELAIKGNAENVSKEIIKRELVSRLDHAAYLGRELMKAEIALKLGKNYVQDEELDFGIYNEKEKIYRKLLKS